MPKKIKVTIVVPVYNQWKLVQGLLDGLSRHEYDNIDSVVLVDDASTEPMDIKTDLPCIVWNTNKNVGFTLACNAGLKLVCGQDFAEKHIVFLISSDVIINGKFIDQAADVLMGARRALVGNRHIVFDSGWNTFEGKTFDYLEGYFLAETSDGWRILNYFDENYAPHDMEDIDLSTAAKKLGYKLVSLNNPNIIHLGGRSIGYNPERESVTIRNKEYFRKKWLG